MPNDPKLRATARSKAFDENLNRWLFLSSQHVARRRPTVAQRRLSLSYDQPSFVFLQHQPSDAQRKTVVRRTGDVVKRKPSHEVVDSRELGFFIISSRNQSVDVRVPGKFLTFRDPTSQPPRREENRKKNYNRRHKVTRPKTLLTATIITIIRVINQSDTQKGRPSSEWKTSSSDEVVDSGELGFRSSSVLAISQLTSGFPGIS